MALIIGDEDVETSACLRGVEILVFFLLGKRDSNLLLLFFKKLPGVGVSSGCRA